MKEPVLTVIDGHLEGREVDKDDDEDEDDDGRSVGELVDSDDGEEVVTPEMVEAAKREKEIEAEFDDYMARPMSAKEVLDVLKLEENDQGDQEDKGICGAIGVRTDETVGRNTKRWFEH